jgi:DNA-binding beta-propeller fold protein YncE
MNRLPALLLLFGVLGAASAQDRPLDYDQVRSDNAFRDGVAAFHSGLYNKAILALEESLRYKPAALPPRSWLGEALWASGLEEQALNEWHHVLRAGLQDDVLAARVDVLEARRSLVPDLRTPDRYLPLYELAGKAKDNQGHNLFLRPSSVRALPDGGFLLVAFGSEEVVQADASGNLVRRFVGTVGGLRAPFDLLPWGNSYFVSEFTADQIVVLDANGLQTKAFGKRGRAEGQFLGPQFLATDGEALYVTDWGNARVSKFDRDGNFLLSFGPATPGFAGLKNPTGVAAKPGIVYVADKALRTVSSFDPSGNWLASYGQGRLTGPEGLTLLADGRLLVSDGARVFFLDTNTDTLVPFDPEWSQGLKVTSAVLDANHNLVLADFDDNKVRVLAEGNTIYSGLSARVTRVNTRNYPEITVSFTVEDRWGRPVTGLGLSNFLVNESGTKIAAPTLAFQGFKSTDAEVALVVDRDPSMARFETEVKEAVGFFTQSWAEKGGIGLFPASANPVPQNQKLSGVGENQRLAVDPSNLTTQGRLDSAIRQAAGSLIPGLARRTVVYVTAGTVPTRGFVRNSLTETASYLKNNGLVFSVVSVNGLPVAPELVYLTNETGGKVWSVKDDLRPFLDEIPQRVVGTYAVTWTSVTPAEAGVREIPVIVEIQKFKQSARTKSSFFAPR